MPDLLEVDLADYAKRVLPKTKPLKATGAGNPSGARSAPSG